jgi:hypothetical protein
MSTGTETMRGVVVIENSLIDSLVAREDFRSEFPHLARLVQVKQGRGCGRCPKKQRTVLAEYRTFKNELAALQPQDKIRFKQFLRARQVRVVHVNAANKVTDRTF